MAASPQTLDRLDATPLDASAAPFDATIVFVAGLLMTIGVAMVYSASVSLTGADLDWRQWWHTPLRQCVFALVGFLGMLFVAHCDYRWFAWSGRWSLWRIGVLYVLAIVLLIAVLLAGREVLGAQRALVVMHSPFTLSFQPAEFAKVVLVLWLAALLARWQQTPADRPHALPRIRQFRRGFAPVALSGGLLVGLTGIEDYGTAALMGVLMVLLLTMGGARWLHLGGLGLLGVLGGAALLLAKDYRRERLLTFFSQGADPSGDGYQVYQSLLTIGSGGWLGRGLGAGIQKYGYLPQKDNDFILATICEELGVVGGALITLLFLVLLWRGWLATRRADTEFGRLVAAGLTTLICLQAAFNVGVVTNSVPTKGISLPFVSAGGSGVLFLGVATGLLASIGGRRAGQRRGAAVGRAANGAG